MKSIFKIAICLSYFAFAFVSYGRAFAPIKTPQYTMPVYFDTTVDVYLKDMASSNWNIKNRYTTKVIKDGSRIDNWCTRYDFDAGKIKDDGFEYRFFWTGEKLGLQQRQSTQKELKDYNAFLMNQLDTQVRFSEVYGNFLDGNIMSEEKNIYDIFRENEKNVKFFERDSYSTATATALLADKRAIYKIWIDPKTNLFSRYEISKYSSDITGNESVDQKNRTELIAVHDIEFAVGEKDSYLPVSGVYEDIISSVRDGKVVKHYKIDAKRKNIKWNPDLKSLNAFEFVLPEGHHIRDMSSEMQYTWSNGKMAPAIDND